MSELPTGTVTFLFTDIQGSTRLLHELGDGFGELLNEHHRILREGLTRHGGVEVGTDGDAFFVAFATVTDAVNAAAQIQRALAKHRAGSGIELWVRMGLHTGEAQLVGDNYGGLDVHRTARISAAAHGGQVLLSAATAHQVQPSSRLDNQVRVGELGEFRLKDLAGPEQLFQLCIEGLPSDFPPPAALGNPLHLPPDLDGFVARQREIQDIRSLLADNRLVTLTGPGGTGKSRLAIEVGRMSATDFPDGIFFVGLATIIDSELVPSTIAGALSLREEGARPVIATVFDYLLPKRVLLILDNFEQVVDSASVVSDLLRAAPGLKAIVTSRVSLLVAGEHEYSVPPMSVPDPQRLPELGALSQYETIDLFLQRARSVKPDFELTDETAPVIAAICVRLDGLPLAIELAAARARFLSPGEILARLDRSLTLLSKHGRDIPQRQRTLMDAIGWSYDLLDAEHQSLFRNLGIFRGGWTLEDAESIGNPEGTLSVDVVDGLESLVSSSLVRTWNPDESQTRFVMLKTIREYAVTLLADRGELEPLNKVHAIYFANLTRVAEPDIFKDKQYWPDRLDLEHDNLRAALRHFIDSAEIQQGLVMATHLWRFWQLRSHLAEGLAWLSELLAAPRSKDDPAARASALIAAGSLTYWQNDFASTRLYYQEALDTFESIDDRGGIAEALYNIGFLHLIEGDSKRARGIHERSLAIFGQMEDELKVAYVKWGLAMSDLRDGDLERAAQLARESLETFEAHRDWFGTSLGDFVLVQVTRIEGDYEKALALLREGLEKPETQKDPATVSSLLEIQANTEIESGRPRRGLKLAGAAAQIRTEYGGGAPPPLLGLDDPRELADKVLSEETIESLWAEGQQMSVAEIVAYALKDPESEE